MATERNAGKGSGKDWTVFLSVRVPVSLADRIATVATMRGESRSDYIRDVLERSTQRSLAGAA